MQDFFSISGYVAALDIGEDRLTRADLHALEGLLISCNRGHRGRPAYNQVLNRFLGKPRASTVGVNMTTAILSPGSKISAVGKSTPRVQGVHRSTRAYEIERAAYISSMLDGGISVTVTSAPNPTGSGPSVNHVYLSYF